MTAPIPRTPSEQRLQAAWLELRETMQQAQGIRDGLQATVNANRESAERARLLDIKLSERRDRRHDDEEAPK